MSDSESDVVSYARVKYVDDDVVEIIPTSTILEFKNYAPEHVNDFDKTKIYTAEYIDDKNPQGVEIPIQISNLYYNHAEASRDTKRPVFSKLNTSDLDAYNEKISAQAKSDENFQTQKKKMEVKSKSDKKMKDDQSKIVKSKISSLLQANNLNISRSNTGIDMHIPEDKSNNKDNVGSELNDLRNENARLLERNREHEKQIAAYKKELFALKQRFDNLRIINEKLQNELFLNNKNPTNYEHIVNDRKDSNLTDISEFSPNHGSTISQQLELEDQSSDLNYEAKKVTSTPKTSEIGKTQDLHESIGTTPKSTKPNSKCARKRIIEPSGDSDLDDTKETDKDCTTISKKQKYDVTKTETKSQENDETTKEGNCTSSENKSKKFLVRYTKMEDKIQVKMVALSEEVHMTDSDWNTYMKKSNASLFTKAILKHIYSLEELSQRSVSGKPQFTTPRGINPRKAITPKKLACIQKCTRYYLKKTLKLDGKALDKAANSCNHYITEEIKTIIGKIKSGKITI